MLADAKRRARSSPSGTIGAATRRSHATNAAKRSTAATSSTPTRADAHDARLVSIKPNVSRNSPLAASSAPIGSSARAPGSRDSRTPTVASARPATPIGTFTQKTDDQAKACSRMPPRMGPIPNPRPATAAQVPIALVRRSGGNASTRIERVSAAMSAPPTPWSARATMSSGSVRASAHSAEQAVKTARPTR